MKNTYISARYSMSLPVSTVVVGMESLELLQQNLKIASTFKMIPEKEKSYLLEKTRPYGEDGKYELHKTSKSYDSGR